MQPHGPFCALYGHFGRPNSGLWRAPHELEADAAPSMENVRGGFLERAGGNVYPFPQLVS